MLLVAIAAGSALALLLDRDGRHRTVGKSPTVTVTIAQSPADGNPARSTSTPSSSGIEATPPAGKDAPDTITELSDAGRVEDDFGGARIGTQTIAGKTYADGVAMNTDRSGDDFSTETGTLPVSTRARYSRLRGVVGIDGDSECPRNDATVSITDDEGSTLWGPEKVTFTLARKFDIEIDGLPLINLVQRSLAPSYDSCGDGQTYTAWGQLEFVK